MNEKYTVIYEGGTFGTVKAELTQVELGKLLLKRGTHLISVNADPVPYRPRKKKRG